MRAITAILLLITIFFSSAPTMAAETDAKLRASEEKMIQTLRGIHEEDLGFRNLLECYQEADEPSLRRNCFDAIWVYTEDELKKIPAPELALKKKLIDLYRADFAEYEKARYPDSR